MTTPTPPTDPGLQALAVEADSLGQADQGAQQGTTQEQAEAMQAMKMLQAGMASVVLMALKVARAAIARRLPEIREEWPDELLEAPAEAAVPLLRKHLDRLMQVVGTSPELAAFVMSLIPLALGAITAIDKAQTNAARTVEAVPADGT